MLDGESSAFPRGIELGISGANAGTEFQLNTVRRRHGWQRNREFKVHLSRVGRRLQVEGVNSLSLPAGSYNFSFRLRDMTFKQQEHKNVEVPKTDLGLRRSAESQEGSGFCHAVGTAISARPRS